MIKQFRNLKLIRLLALHIKNCYRNISKPKKLLEIVVILLMPIIIENIWM
nr:MAG TPA: hypothetical protein [Bacteriophage sp.]